jgi:hypothetical protein
MVNPSQPISSHHHIAGFGSDLSPARSTLPSGWLTKGKFGDTKGDGDFERDLDSSIKIDDQKNYIKGLLLVENEEL